MTVVELTEDDVKAALIQWCKTRYNLSENVKIEATINAYTTNIDTGIGDYDEPLWRAAVVFDEPAEVEK